MTPLTTMMHPILLLALAAAAPPAAGPPSGSTGAAVARPAAAASFVPADFAVPTRVAVGGFTLVPLGPALVDVDYDAYMSSIDHLQKSFSRSTRWPHAGLTRADAMQDMDAEQARFAARRSFAYAVLSPDGRRERGCVYVSPSPVPGHDAVVRLWVTKAEHDAGFDAELYTWVTGWIAKEWPFRSVAYPGRSIDWKSWDRQVAATAPAKRPPA